MRPDERRPALRRRIALLALVAVALSGCVSLLPKQKPSHLYRFGVPSAAAPPRADAVGVFRAGGGFQRESAGDRILTVTGDRTAYIAEVRWVAPAEVLFDEAVSTAFDSAPGHLRLVARGEAGRAALALRLDVRNFETHYAGERPTVLIRVRAVLAHGPGQSQIAEQVFEARAQADQNRVGSIVAAYNEALAKVLGDIVGWTNGYAI